MEFDVREKTLQRTDKCWQGYDCLSGNQECLCQVTDSVRGVLFVERETSDYCPYDMSFGYSHICCCPTRQEIYDRYNV
ncbi:MAG: hypothetical protein PVF54_08250 [Anaerolineae bacterium]|jgi:hypothetical protein